MTALALVTGGSDAERAVDLFILFDTLSGFPRSITTLFESACPGATDALHAWAAARGLATHDLFIPDAPVPTRVVHVDCPGGANFSIQRAA